MMAPTTESDHRETRSELLRIAQRSRDVWNLIGRRHQGALLAAGVLMALAAWLNALIPVTLGALATNMASARKIGSVWGLRDARPFLISLAMYFLSREGLQVLRKYLVHNTCTKVEKDTATNLVAHLLRVDLSVLTTRERIGSLHGRIRRSVEGFVKLLHLACMDLLPAIFTAIFALVMALRMQPLLGMLMTAVIPIAMLIMTRQIGSQKGIRLELLRSKEDVDGTVVEQLGGIEYVRAANTEKEESRKVEEVAEVVRRKELKHHVAMSLYDCAKTLNEGVFFILVVAASIWLAANERISPGDIIAFVMLFGSILAPLREIHRIVDEAHESALKVTDLMSMMAMPIDVSFDTTAVQEPRLADGASIIEVADLAVQYVTADGDVKAALTDASVILRRGETIGVAGPSASGKSTWVKALLRLLHPTAGTIRVGGVPISHVSREAIGRLIGYVGQNPFLFSGTVAENISYGCAAASDDEIYAAAKRAYIHDEIVSMPGGYGARISERGNNLSGGQRQRLALARVFLKNPPILILDEATSALDNISERRIQKALADFSHDRTVILVAHRLSTLKDADRILVFGEGRIVETGSYDALIARNGLFAQLARHAEEKDLAPVL